MSAKSAAPVIGSVAAMLALAGTFAVVQLSQSPQHESQRQVELVQPAAQTVTVTPSPTTTTVAVAPKKVAPKPAPVESTTSAAVKKATTTQRQAVVSEPAPETTTSEATPKFGIDPRNGKPNPPPVKRPSPTSTN
jgi:hypothetical protein